MQPAVFPAAVLRWRDQPLAARLGLGELDEAAWLAHFARFEPLPHNLPQPQALRYHGHQLRHYNPELGDGRGFLFAQLLDADGAFVELGTKGSGTTPWSRGGDGRLTLRGGLRELLAARLLAAQRVPVNGVLSLVETGESLVRFDEPSPTRSCVLVRALPCHVRVGSLQRLHHLGDREGLRRLVDHAAAVWYPELPSEDLPRALLARVVERSAALVAGWMVAGFVHGVLNTDNLNLTGHSFDHGPWRWLPRCDPTFTAAYFDEVGLYAYARQPGAVRWAMERLADALTLVEDRAALARALAGYDAAYTRALGEAMCRRLGLRTRGEEADRALVRAVSVFLAHSPVGFERFFFDWFGGLRSAQRAQGSPEGACYQGPLFAALTRTLEGYDALAPQALEHPYFQDGAPCTLLAEEVDALLVQVADQDDWSALGHAVQRIDRMAEALSLGNP